jgi:hypothetical protein
MQGVSVSIDALDSPYANESPTTGFEQVSATERAQKILINGQLYILVGEQMYNLQGQRMK